MAGVEQTLQVDLAWSPAPGQVEVLRLSLPAAGLRSNSLQLNQLRRKLVEPRTLDVEALVGRDDPVRALEC